MATLVLGAAGGALGSVFGGVGAILGRAAGAMAGYAIDQALFGKGSAKATGPRLSDLEVQASTEGAVLPRVYGTCRLAGQIIWATDFEEVVQERTEGGKGAAPKSTTEEYAYFANFAVALCEGRIARIGRIWADGKPLDASEFTIRIYDGGEAQLPDSLIVAKQGGEAPAYRGTAYVVFERMPLAEFGNRLPQLSFEVFRPMGGIEEHIRAICVIPGSTEFGYDPLPLSRIISAGTYRPENTHVSRHVSDWTVSLDELQALCPKLEWVTLVVAWFGDDLRAGSCSIRPKVDDRTKAVTLAIWQVNGVTRDDAHRVSLLDGRPAYGGSPSDLSVKRAIEDLKARGLKVVLAPFVLMDIPPGNALPDPRTGLAGQPAFPWRGEITCDPAPGRPGSPDKSPAAASIAAAFLGSAGPDDFDSGMFGPTYSGPAGWGYRRMVLHYAHLAAWAGGVDGFLIGSELCGLTVLRSGTSAYPFVSGLRDLAADARSVVGPATRISYAADWSEYFGHQPGDGTGDVHFHLDPLWADANVDAVGIDIYHPLADWRDDSGHVDEAVAGSTYELNYLRANIRGGEGFDWFYASAADRLAQLRTPISDAAAGKPWVFRFKDIEAWWSNPHFDRPGGAEAATPTAWIPRSKPIWFTELGCPAVDKGANQPNVFYDPKSAQSALPRFSSGARDDLIQRNYIDAFLRFFDPAHDGFNGSNPVSPLYGGRMVDPAHLHLWAWDARPYPHFPDLAEVWSDGGNWERGHWLNGRLGRATLAELIRAILADHGFADHEVGDMNGLLEGYLVNEVLSARSTLEPLLQAFRADAADAGDRLRFRGRERAKDAALAPELLVERPDEALVTRRRAQETELPSELVLRLIDPGKDYRMAAVASRRLASGSRRTSTIDLTAVLDFAQAESLAEELLQDIWTGREEAELRLPPSLMAIEPGDLLALPAGGADELLLADRIEDGESRAVHLRRVDRRRVRSTRPQRRNPPATAPAWGPAQLRVLDFAPPDGREAHAPRLAVFADPWPGIVAIYRAGEGGGFRRAATLTRPAVIGYLLDPLLPGPLGRFDRANRIEVELLGGGLSGLPEANVLAGGNAAAVQSGSGWEVLQFVHAELTGPRRYRLSRLLRGQAGTEPAMASGAAAGADFVLLDAAVVPLPVGAEPLRRPLRYRVGPGRDDHAAPSFVEQVVAAAGIGLRPFAPVHLRARRDPTSGDVTLRWIRRSRVGGLDFEAAEVPLGEERERYLVEVLDGATVKRSFDVGASTAIYPAAAQSADWGGPPGALAWRVRQWSRAFGWGAAAGQASDL